LLPTCAAISFVGTFMAHSAHSELVIVGT